MIADPINGDIMYKDGLGDSFEKLTYTNDHWYRTGGWHGMQTSPMPRSREEPVRQISEYDELLDQILEIVTELRGEEIRKKDNLVNRTPLNSDRSWSEISSESTNKL